MVVIEIEIDGEKLVLLDDMFDFTYISFNVPIKVLT